MLIVDQDARAALHSEAVEPIGYPRLALFNFKGFGIAG